MNADKSSNGGTLLAAVSYMGILCLIPFIIGGRNEFTLFHARQGLILWIWEVIALGLLVIPFAGHLAFIISAITCFVFSIMGIYHAIMGNYWQMPFFSRFSKELT
ncbi:MAG: hypothetical protein HN353_09785 [Bdellovibrionales bacterium]|jgi:fumarate reductase subunit D|nr:hypothetical protein [Bdellovibrionales bacterium]MBT3527189.1 hypothetical protein [Bdellovibrionales bacterium]MBT7668136.1 hypothetical protein [Bdellovibrionales bacterium]MBT7766564.1 hypothetical protein [Bdellovibrionales bacterium]